MICFDPLWETMKKKGVTTYTLNRLCEILDCGLEDVAKYIPDKKE